MLWDGVLFYPIWARGSGKAAGQCPVPLSTNLNGKKTPSSDMLLVVGQSFLLPNMGERKRRSRRAVPGAPFDQLEW